MVESFSISNIGALSKYKVLVLSQSSILLQPVEDPCGVLCSLWMQIYLFGKPKTGGFDSEFPVRFENSRQI